MTDHTPPTSAEERTPPEEQITPAGQDNTAITYTGQVGELWRLSLVVTLLTIATLGIYRFWGRTRIRRYIWSHIAIDDDAFEYTGTGGELFKGFLIVVAILSPLLIAHLFIEPALISAGGDLLFLYKAAIFGIAAFLIQVAIFRARRYRLSRTVWRGIRGAQTGKAWHYGVKSALWGLLVVFTLGLAYPVWQYKLLDYQLNNTWFGNQRFEFDGRAADLFKLWIGPWLLLPFTLGASLFWYRAAQLRYVTSRLTVANISFSSDVRGSTLFLIYLMFGIVFGVVSAVAFGLSTGLLAAASESGGFDEVGNWIGFGLSVLVLFVLIPTLSLPLLTHPTLAAVVNGMIAEGKLDADTIRQAQQTPASTGEGLAGVLDVDAF